MTRILHTNDWHLWHLTPSSRLDSWPDTLFRKLDQVAEIAEIHGVDAIAVAGDLFHSVNTAYAVVERLIRWARERAVHAIPGNHDERYNRYDSLQTTPVGTVFAAEAIVDVSYHVRAFPGDGPQIVGIPWPDSKDLASWAKVAQLIDPSKPAVVLAHAFASKTGGQVFGQPALSYEALSAYPFQVYHFGHDHSAKSSTKLHGKYFLNFGALGRGSLATEDISRDIFVAISEFKGFEVSAQLVKLKVEPAEKVFDLQRYAYEKQVVQAFEAGLGQQIAADFLAMVDDQSIAAHVALLTLDDEVRARLQQYLMQVEEAVA